LALEHALILHAATLAHVAPCEGKNCADPNQPWTKYGVEIITMLNVEKCYRLTLVLHTSTSTFRNTPVQVVAHNIRQDSCCTGQISYEQAGMLLVRTFHEPTIIQEYMNALLENELVELCGVPDDPNLFSAHELSAIGIPLELKQSS
jgi:hypothetical protein